MVILPTELPDYRKYNLKLREIEDVYLIARRLIQMDPDSGMTWVEVANLWMSKLDSISELGVVDLSSNDKTPSSTESLKQKITDAPDLLSIIKGSIH